ncbi:MAG TPA: hypothetical protein VIX19_09585 [Terriglobales bacterium]
MSVSEADATNSERNGESGASAPHPHSGPRQDDGIYQGGRLVGLVLNPKVDSEAREIRFGVIHNSEELLLPDDCEFRNYRILIQRLDFATREERGAAHKGRVLKGVVAEILGFREQ